MANSVVCIAFAPRPNTTRGPWVALVEKNAPPWQAGSLNGPSGPITTTAADAAEEHFEDETGVNVPAGSWAEMATLTGGGETVHIMTTELLAVVPVTETGPEPASWYATDNIPAAAVDYVKWLVPMLLDSRMTAGSVTYTNEGAP